MKYIPRELAGRLTEEMKWFPVVSITGPRQSGKSTLAKHCFSDYAYVNLENPQARAAAIEDPVSFIRNRPERLIIDEAQYAPDLFSMIQVVSDERGSAGQYILTGSQNFLLMKNIGQSLAGRVGVLKLLPLSYKELFSANRAPIDILEFILKGGYPRLYDLDIPLDVFFPNYIETYVDRDVAGLLDVRNISAFRTMVELCAQNVGNLLNVSRLASAAGVSVPTIDSWLSVLQSSYLVFKLPSFARNLSKRLTKAPKLYFYDTGLLCSLLHIKTVRQLIEHPQFGAIFENLVVSERLKDHLNKGEEPQLYFYRDDSKREVDLLDLTDPDNEMAVEVKSSQTFHEKYAKHLNAIGEMLRIRPENKLVVCRVESSYRTKTCEVVNVCDFLLSE